MSFTITASSTPGVRGPGIGWVLVIKADQYDALKGRFGHSHALWEMYDIQVIPLHGDIDTNDIYEFMTPINWRK